VISAGVCPRGDEGGGGLGVVEREGGFVQRVGRLFIRTGEGGWRGYQVLGGREMGVAVESIGVAGGRPGPQM